MGAGSHVGFPISVAEMFIGWSYTRFLLLVLIGNPTWLLGPIMSHNSIGLVVSNKKIFKISTNQNTLWTLAAMLDFDQGQKQKSCI
jgi:hypothetical protein